MYFMPRKYYESEDVLCMFYITTMNMHFIAAPEEG